MRACLLVCAALALAACRPRAAAASHATHAEPARLEHIKTQILAKLGLTSRPTPLGTPPRDVVRQILARADTHPEPAAPQEQSMREIIAIAHRGDVDEKEISLEYDTIHLDEFNVLLKSGDRSNVRYFNEGRDFKRSLVAMYIDVDDKKTGKPDTIHPDESNVL